MRSSTLYLLPTTLLSSVAHTLQLPNLQPFLSALQDYSLFSQSNNDTADHDLLKRQYSNTCPDDFNSCASLGAPNLCCMSNAICSADQANNVACCPTGAVCTGAITGVITSGTIGTDGAIVGGGGAATATSAPTTSFEYASSTTTNGLVPASTEATVGTDGSTASGSGFIVVGESSTVATPGAGARRAEVVSLKRPLVHNVTMLTLVTARCCSSDYSSCGVIATMMQAGTLHARLSIDTRRRK